MIIITIIAKLGPATLKAYGRARTPVPIKLLKRVKEACKLEDSTTLEFVWTVMRMSSSDESVDSRLGGLFFILWNLEKNCFERK